MFYEHKKCIMYVTDFSWFYYIFPIIYGILINNLLQEARFLSEKKYWKRAIMYYATLNSYCYTMYEMKYYALCTNQPPPCFWHHPFKINVSKLYVLCFFSYKKRFIPVIKCIRVIWYVKNGLIYLCKCAIFIFNYRQTF